MFFFKFCLVIRQIYVIRQTYWYFHNPKHIDRTCTLSNDQLTSHTKQTAKRSSVIHALRGLQSQIRKDHRLYETRN